MQQRKKIGALTLIIIGLLVGYAIKNVRAGLILGLALGLLASGLLTSKN
ncbi:MAG: hypothetical protein KGZ59_10365 [Chitinophagaceae bacterium]|nr:hypothetical protein [Chitinophagaceae bacterium]